MIKEAIGFGSSIDEAKEDALLRLGARDDEDVQFEVITMPKAKILGIFGGSKAEVKAFVERPDKPAKKNKNNSKKADNAKPAKKEKQTKAEPKKEKTAPKAKEQPAVELVDQSLIEAGTPTGKAIAYLNAILKSLGCENIAIKAAVRENGALITLDGEGLGVVIGHRGETLDALQHLVSLAANNSGGYFKVTLNIGDYREKREQTLVSLAGRVAEQVVKTSRNRALEPMSAYERRIIHTAVQEIDGVNSASVGEGKNRRVVIFPEGGTPSMPRRDGGRRRNDRGRKPSNTVASAPAREPKRDSDIPLYGKIN
ncbi:MAG: RNA-binding cell elongation regulator Jag/EloR [Clostridia bacterium]|nr:RNA-binding cell elongation regulator Jag/EloR [Clostridia bacterium]